MKGVILKGLREFVEERIGASAWHELVRDLDHSESPVAVSRSYPDALVAQIVQRGARETKLSTTEFLRTFGRYWMTHTGPRSYPQVFRLARRDPIGFLERLDLLHDAVTRNLEGARPPVIRVVWKEKEELLLEYASDKQLPELVRGLLEGLGAISGREVQTHEPVPVTGDLPRWQMKVRIA